MVSILAGSALGSPSDPVAALDRRLAAGEVRLSFDPRWGYLPAVLSALDVPVSSQVLVFSKTSAQFRLINPGNPRAIYFNDETYVGWVPGGPFLEISTAVAGGTAAFYSLPQRRAERPRLVADDGACLQCHESPRTLGVPGHLTRSVFPGEDGLPHFAHGTVNVDHATPITRRWGGWFVTGNVPMPHRGNSFGPERSHGEWAAGRLERPPASLFDPRRYLVPHSDVVAHLVLAHQTRVHNSLARAGAEARNALAYQQEMERLFGRPSESLLASVRRRIERPAEQLVRDLLLVGEAPLDGPVEGDSVFAEEFQRSRSVEGADDPLRELHLGTRLFRRRCSFLIRSASYARLPRRVRVYVQRRLAEILEGRNAAGDFAHLGPEDREAIRRLLGGRLALR